MKKGGMATMRSLLNKDGDDDDSDHRHAETLTGCYSCSDDTCFYL